MAAFINSSSDRLFSVTPTHSFELHDYNSDTRVEAEQAVKNIFRKVYAADISEFAPALVCAQRNNKIDTVIGLRNAGQSELFLENYLNTSIEQTIYQKQGISIERNKLMELGNLVAIRSGSSRQLFIALAFALEAAEVEWACFTATTQVRQLLRKLGLEPIELCLASEQAVVNGDSWGRYYADAPSVCFGNVYTAVRKLRQMPTVVAIYPMLESCINTLAKQIKKGFNHE